jgi:uroporphyrinogen decarboxylase
MTGITRFEQSHKSRMEECLAGNRMPYPPVALWRHFPVDDQMPDRLAAAIVNFQSIFDFDLVKVTPASSFCLRDWGVHDIWNGDSEGTRSYTSPIIDKPEDWLGLLQLDPYKGFLGKQLEVLRLISPQYAQHTPVLQTIFNPMSQAKNLAGQDALLKMMRSDPESLHAGLKTITRTTIRFIQACMEIGIDGIFLAIQHAQSNLLSEAEFEAFSLPYDLEILAAAKDLWLNMVHIHGEGIFFENIEQYPAQILNWHDRHTSPSIAEARQNYSGVICGGLSRLESLVLGDPAVIRKEAQNAIQDSGGSRFVLGTGCVVPITAPFGNLLAARNSVFPA